MAAVTAQFREFHVPNVRLRSVTGVWMRHWEAFARYWAINMTWILIEPAIMLMAVAFGIGQLVTEVEGAPTYAIFVTPGIIMGSAMFHSLFETSWNAYNRIDQDLYHTQLTAPVTPFEITLGDISWGVTKSLMTAVAVIGFAAIFGWVEGWLSIGIIIPAVLTGIMFGAMGFLFSTTAPYIAFMILVFTLVATPLFFFSGTFFPLSVLPGWAQGMAQFMPMTPAVHIARGFATDTLGWEHLWSGLYMLALTAIMWPAAVWLLRRRLVK